MELLKGLEAITTFRHRAIDFFAGSANDTLAIIAKLQAGGKQLIMAHSEKYIWSEATILHVALYKSNEHLLIWLLLNGPNICGNDDFLQLALKKIADYTPMHVAYFFAKNGKLGALLHFCINELIKTNTNPQLNNMIKEYNKANWPSMFLTAHNQVNQNNLHLINPDTAEQMKATFSVTISMLNESSNEAGSLVGNAFEKHLEAFTAIASAKQKLQHQEENLSGFSNHLSFLWRVTHKFPHSSRNDKLKNH